MSAPRISVILPTRDRPTLLEEALASIRTVQGPDLDIQIVVSDNGLSSEVERITAVFHGVYVRATTPGPAAARNAGARAATGEYLTFLDDDDVWLPTHLRAHLELLNEDSRLAAVIGQNVGVDMSLRDSGPPHPRSLLDPADMFRSLLGVVPQIGSVVVRQCAWKVVGPFDESLLAAEDWDWYLRLALLCRVAFIAEPCLLNRSRPFSRAEDAITAMYQRYTLRVFWTNVRRAGLRRLPPHVTARMWLRRVGYFAAKFLVSAEDHARIKDYDAARHAFVLAARASALHTVWWLMHSASLRQAVWHSFAD